MAGRGLEPSGFQGSALSPNSRNNNSNRTHQNRVHPPTEENTTEDDEGDAESQNLEEDGGDGRGGGDQLLLANANHDENAVGEERNDNKQQQQKLLLQQQQSDEEVLLLNGMTLSHQHQQHNRFAEEASRVLSRLQIQASSVSNNTVDSQQLNAIIVPPDDNGGNHKLSAMAASDNNNDHFSDENDNNNNRAVGNNQLVCTNNDNDTSVVKQDESYGPLTVLPPNELSATTSEAALAANTFSEMIRHAQHHSAGVSAGAGCAMSVGSGEQCPPGFFVDESGVVRRSGGGGGAAAFGGGGGGMPYPSTAGVGGVLGGMGGSGVGGGGGNIGTNNDQHGMKSSNCASGVPIIGGGMQHPGGGLAASTVSSSAGMRSLAGRGRDPFEGEVFNDDEEEDDDDDEENDDDDDEEEDSSEISASDEDGSWIAWFCGLRGNEFFCEVDEDYIQDDFNLTGLVGLVPCYEYALDMVLDVEIPMEDSFTEEQQEIVESAAEMLYGLIHARYIVTNRGMHAMYEKYRSASFGRCPHVFCQGQPVLPVGLSDLPRNYTVNVFCPRCHGLFFPKSTRQANIDGAYFGTTFPHLYLMSHPVSLSIITLRARGSFIQL